MNLQTNLMPFVIIVFAISNSAAAIEYHFAALDPMPVPMSINNNGQIVGAPEGSGGNAVLYSGGSLTALPVSHYQMESRLLIANSGEIVGDAAQGPPLPMWYRDGQWNDVNSLAGVTAEVRNIYDINNVGQILGRAIVKQGGNQIDYSYSFVYGQGVMRNLNLSPEWQIRYGNAVAMNDMGQVLLTSTYGNTLLHPDGSWTDLGELVPRDLNNAGQVVGNIWVGDQYSGGYRAYLWDNGELIDLDTLTVGGGGGSSANKINNRGQVIGRDSRGSSFLYSDGKMYDVAHIIDVDATGWFFGPYIRDINDDGLLVGTFCEEFPAFKGFIMTPIPEPASLVFLCLGMLSLVPRSTRRRIVCSGTD